MSVRLIREVIRGRAIKVDRRICERAGCVKVDVALLPIDNVSPATMRLRNADDDSDDQLKSQGHGILSPPRQVTTGNMTLDI